jgi:hypothetical protein
MSIKYDPSKKYTWSNEDKFVLSGGEFGLILNTLRSILSTEEAARVLMANRANEVIESLFQKSVEEGVIKESTE